MLTSVEGLVIARQVQLQDSCSHVLPCRQTWALLLHVPISFLKILVHKMLISAKFLLIPRANTVRWTIIIIGYP